MGGNQKKWVKKKKKSFNYAHMYSHMTHELGNCTRCSHSHSCYLGGDGLLQTFTPLMKPIMYCEFSEDIMCSNHRTKY